MEKKSENEGFEKLMEKYNFDSPIEVTLVIEEEDPPEPVSLKALLLSNNVPDTNGVKNSSEVYKRTDSNIDNDKIKMLNANKICNSKSIIEESNHSNSVFKTVFSEGYQEKSQDIEWQLLDAVADNLIHITKCYYHNFNNNKKQMENYESLTFEYLTFKHYFFNLSYSTTITILLPRENDKKFINTFIHRIIEIANRSSWCKITYEILEKLIREMFIWTKQKKTNLDIKFGSHIHEKGDVNCYSYEVTNNNSQNLNRSSDNDSIINHASEGSNSQPDMVSKTHPPVNIINISPNIRHITNYSTQELNSMVISPKNISTKNICTKTIYSMGNIDNSTSSFYTKNNAEPKRTKQCHTNMSENFHLRPEINISHSIIQKTNHGSSSPITFDGRINNLRQEINRSFIDSRMNHSTTRITSNYNIEPKTNNFSSCQARNTNSSTVLLSSGPPNQEITISIDSEILANINLQNINQLNNNATESHINVAYGTKSIKRRKTTDSSYYPYSNLNSLPHHNDNNFHCNKINSSSTNLKSAVDDRLYDDSRRAGNVLSNTDTLRSSISRDSGCDSPIHGSFHNEQTIEMSNNEKQVFPVISHVTSMNPNAVRLNVGFCKVCGATTSNMCIGCYQDYYCSPICQSKNWENHKNICSISPR